MSLLRSLGDRETYAILTKAPSCAHKSAGVGLEEAGMEKGMWAWEDYGQTGKVCQTFPFLCMRMRARQTKSIPIFFFFAPELDMILTTLIQGNLAILFHLHKC